MASEAPPSFLLPSTVKPSHYDVRLAPDFETFKFKGQATVTVTVAEGGSRTAVCHAKQLEVYSVVADSDNVGATTFDEKLEQLTITFASPLAAGEHTLVFTFSGTLNDDMAGFYRSSFTDPDGKKVWIATTQFESCDARRAFPCWDEPVLKATFNVTLTHPTEFVALSNMPAEDVRDNEDGTTTTSYGKTPKMSSYLLAFVIGPFEHISGTTAGGIPIRVFTTPGKKAQGAFALDNAIDALDFLGDFFDQPYVLPKLDMVAIPDFAAGAMENWGLVTYRTNALLISESSSAAMRQRVAYVVAHELSHQWFGNLVSPMDWSYLYLNEGFATQVGWAVVHAKYPDWQIWPQFVGSEMSRALDTDSMLSSHPIEVPIEDPSMIDQVFDALSYSKGASIIRMVESYIGRDKFQQGMRAYVKRHAFGNATSNDLWESLSEASGLPLVEALDTWVKHMGYPVLTVSEDGNVTQNRFLTTGVAPEEHDKLLWNVPLSCLTAPGGDATPFVSAATRTFSLASLGVADPSKFFKLNAASAAFVRVNYTAAQWATIADNVSSLSAEDKVGLLGDAFALSKSGQLPVSTVLNLYSKFKGETSYPVWSQLVADATSIADLIEGTPVHEAFKAFLFNLYSDAVAHVGGWNGDGAGAGSSHVGALLRMLILKAASGSATSSSSPFIVAGLEVFDKFIADATTVHPDLHDVVMNLGVAHGGAAAHDKVMAVFKGTDSTETRVKCLMALGRTPDEDAARAFLDWAVHSEDVRSNELLYAFMALGTSHRGRTVMWAYVKGNWPALYAKYENASMMLGYVCSLPLRGFSDPAVADDAEAFFKANPVEAANMAINRAVEAIRSKAVWLGRDLPAITEFCESLRK